MRGLPSQAGCLFFDQRGPNWQYWAMRRVDHGEPMSVGKPLPIDSSWAWAIRRSPLLVGDLDRPMKIVKNFACLRRKEKSKKAKSKDPKPSHHHPLTQHGSRD